MGQQGSVERHTKMLRSWQLALLRLAVTLNNADRLGVLALAKEIDRFGSQFKEEPEFGFFRRRSAELCAAIKQRSEAGDAVLRQHLSRIDDARLKSAFASAIEIAHPEPTSIKRRAKPESDLWKGLRSRGGSRD